MTEPQAAVNPQQKIAQPELRDLFILKLEGTEKSRSSG
jgi:hypothetical protein